MTRLGRRYRFSASHRLHSPELTPEQNVAIFGKCNNPYGHGHDYVLEVILSGDIDAQTGLVADLPALDRTVKTAVLADYDHKYMNEEIAAFRDLPPTTENVALDIRARLDRAWPEGSAKLESVRIYETRRNMVEIE